VGSEGFPSPHLLVGSDGFVRMSIVVTVKLQIITTDKNLFFFLDRNK